MKRIAALALAAGALFLVLSCASAPTKSAVQTASPVAAVPGASAAPTASADVTTPAPATQVREILKPYGAATKACLVVLEKAEILAAQGKWLSAYKTMDEFDRANADPFALAMKVSIVLRGAVRSDMNLSFGLADLEAGQDLESLRKGEGDYAPLALDPPALAEAQASRGQAPPAILSKELGDYYYDVLGRFSGQWAISDEEILAKIADSYAKAYGAGVYDSPSLMNYAESLVRINRGDESDPVYAKAIELDPQSGNLLYSYAMSLSYRGKKAEALAKIDRALEVYAEDPAKINAIALGAQTALELGDQARAESYYAIADSSYPDTPTPGVLRHLVAVQTGNKEAAAAAADALVAAFGSNPSVVRTLVSTWFSAGDAASAKAFLQRNAAKGGDDLTVATLDFYLAVLLSQGAPSDEDKASALVALDEAEARFKTVLEPENQVYGVIDQMKAELQPRAAGAQQGAQ